MLQLIPLCEGTDSMKAKYLATREQRRQERRHQRAQAEASRRLSFGLAPFDVFACGGGENADTLLPADTLPHAIPAVPIEHQGNYQLGAPQEFAHMGWH